MGVGTVHARIAFHPPEVLGFSAGRARRPDVAAIVGGFAGDDRRRMQHTKMIHVFLRTGDGVVLRSRFWLGSALRPYAPDLIAARSRGSSTAPPCAGAWSRRTCPRRSRATARRSTRTSGALLPELYEQFA